MNFDYRPAAGRSAHLTLIHAKLMREWYAVIDETPTHYICKQWGPGWHTFQHMKVGFLKRDVINHTQFWAMKVIPR